MILSGLKAPDPKVDGGQVREILTVARRTCSPPRCTEAPYPRLSVQPAERGKPAALSVSVLDRVAQA
jgi:hypothetical protein